MQILHLLHGTLLGRNPGDLMLQHLGIGSRLEARDDDVVFGIVDDVVVDSGDALLLGSGPPAATGTKINPDQTNGVAGEGFATERTGWSVFWMGFLDNGVAAAETEDVPWGAKMSDDVHRGDERADSPQGIQ